MRSGKIGIQLIFFLFNFSIVESQQKVFPLVTEIAKVSILYDSGAGILDSISANLLAQDIERVTSYRPPVLKDIQKANGTIVVIGTLGSSLIQKFISVQSSTYKGYWEKGSASHLKLLTNLSQAFQKLLSLPAAIQEGQLMAFLPSREKLVSLPNIYGSTANYISVDKIVVVE